MTLYLLMCASWIAISAPAEDRELPPTVPFEAPKYGVSTRIPKDWSLAVREKDDRVFVAFIPQDDPNRPGVAACELALAPESLEEYRTRIDTNAGITAGRMASWRSTG